MDKPTHGLMERSRSRRQQEWLDEWRQLQNDVAHWNRTHPGEESIVIEPITAIEIRAALEAARNG